MYRVDTVTTGLDGAPFFTQLFFNDTAGTASDAVDAVVAFWEDLASVIVNDCTMTVDGIVTIVDQATGAITGTEGTASGAAVVGTNAGEPLPNATQGLIQWRTGDYVGGREIRGRTFIPGPGSASNALGEPTSSYIAALEAAAATLVGNASTVFVVFSRAKLTARAVIDGTAWDEWAVLRSRRQ